MRVERYRSRTVGRIPSRLFALAFVCTAQSAKAQVDIRDFVFDGPEDRRYAARLRVPENSNGVSALLIGGGAVTDLNWTTPGSYEQDGQTHRLTTTGESTRDAETIALADAGFVVMQFSSIQEDDDQADHDAAMATGIPYEKSVPIAARALAVLREQAGVDPQRVFLIGHSLGATRACQITTADDQGVIGMAFLAGAYTAKTTQRPSALSAQALEGVDADGDGVVSREEYTAADRAEFDALDRDADGVLRGWELAAHAMLARMDSGEAVLDDAPQFRDGLAWPADLLASRPGRPVLAIYGGLDATSVNGPLLERWGQDHGLDKLTVEYRAGLGHQLSPEQGGLVGPIDESVVRRLVAWARSLE